MAFITQTLLTGDIDMFLESDTINITVQSY